MASSFNNNDDDNACLRCPLCAEDFSLESNQAHTPIQARCPCGSTICSECVSGMHDARPSKRLINLACPYCKAKEGYRCRAKAPNQALLTALRMIKSKDRDSILVSSSYEDVQRWSKQELKHNALQHAIFFQEWKTLHKQPVSDTTVATLEALFEETDTSQEEAASLSDTDFEALVKFLQARRRVDHKAVHVERQSFLQNQMTPFVALNTDNVEKAWEIGDNTSVSGFSLDLEHVSDSDWIQIPEARIPGEARASTPTSLTSSKLGTAKDLAETFLKTSGLVDEERNPVSEDLTAETSLPSIFDVLPDTEDSEAATIIDLSHTDDLFDCRDSLIAVVQPPAGLKQCDADDMGASGSQGQETIVLDNATAYSETRTMISVSQDLSAAEVKACNIIFQVLTELYSLGSDSASRQKLALLSGYSCSTASFRKGLQSLDDNEIITVANREGVRLTEKGKQITTLPQLSLDNAESHRQLLAWINKGQSSFMSTKWTDMFRVLADGEAHTRNEIAEAGAYSSKSSPGFNKFLKRLRDLDLFKENVARGQVQLSDLAFPENWRVYNHRDRKRCLSSELATEGQKKQK